MGDVTAPAARVGVAVPAAGSGRRLGGAKKPFLQLRGEPALVHALRPFLADPRVVSIVVALSAEDAQAPPSWLTDLDARVRVVPGGATRGQSVARAMEALDDDVTVIAVHDAARPLVTAEVVRACIDVAAAGTGAVAGSPAVDTIKAVDDQGRVVATPDRSTLWQAHTPQVFPASMLRKAYSTLGAGATDDASLVERIGGEIRMVDDGNENLKVTLPGDVAIAEAVLAGRSGS